MLMSHRSQYHLSHTGLANSTIKKVLTHLDNTAIGIKFAAFHRHKIQNDTHTKIYMSKHTHTKIPVSFLSTVMVNTTITYEAGTTQIKTIDRIWTEFSCKESPIPLPLQPPPSHKKKKPEKEAKSATSNATTIKKNMSAKYYVTSFKGRAGEITGTTNKLELQYIMYMKSNADEKHMNIHVLLKINPPGKFKCFELHGHMDQGTTHNTWRLGGQNSNTLHWKHFGNLVLSSKG